MTISDNSEFELTTEANRRTILKLLLVTPLRVTAPFIISAPFSSRAYSEVGSWLAYASFGADVITLLAGGTNLTLEIARSNYRLLQDMNDRLISMEVALKQLQDDVRNISRETVLKQRKEDDALIAQELISLCADMNDKVLSEHGSREVLEISYDAPIAMRLDTLRQRSDINVGHICAGTMNQAALMRHLDMPRELIKRRMERAVESLDRMFDTSRKESLVSLYSLEHEKLKDILLNETNPEYQDKYDKDLLFDSCDTHYGKKDYYTTELVKVGGDEHPDPWQYREVKRSRTAPLKTNYYSRKIYSQRIEDSLFSPIYNAKPKRYYLKSYRGELTRQEKPGRDYCQNSKEIKDRSEYEQNMQIKIDDDMLLVNLQAAKVRELKRMLFIASYGKWRFMPIAKTGKFEDIPNDSHIITLYHNGDLPYSELLAET